MLISYCNEDGRLFSDLRYSQGETREVQARALMSDVLQLMSQYGLVEASKGPKSSSQWPLRLNHSELLIVISYRDFDGFSAWRSRGLWGQPDEPLPVSFGLDWDPVCEKWLGPRTGERDFSAPGAPHRRIDALEAMLIAVLEARRLCMEGSKATP